MTTTTTTTVTTTTSLSTTAPSSNVLSSSTAHLKTWPHLVSLVNSPSNSAIKAQLASPGKSRLPCQIVRLISPSGDASAKRNVVLSAENMANIRFIYSSGMITVPKNSILTSSSSAHSSHPVIQQLLLNQPRRPPPSNLTTVRPSGGKVISSQVIGGVQPHAKLAVTGANVTVRSQLPSKTPGTVKVTLISPTATKGMAGHVTTAKSGPPSTTVIVTQVSSSIVSHGGKQILDLGSLSVTQIQQLVKNQAIQINTGVGSPTTLLLTKGLQQLATSKIGTQTVTAPIASVASVKSAPSDPNVPVRIPIQLGQATAAKIEVKDQSGKSLLTTIPAGSVPKPHVVSLASVGACGQTGAMTVLSGKQVAAQLPFIRTIINRPVQNAALVRPVNPSIVGSSISATQLVPGAARLTTNLSQGPFTVVQGGTLPRQSPAPRIISSIPSSLITNFSSTNFCSTPGGSVANKENPQVLSDPEATDSKKPSQINNIPFSPHSSPHKKYAGNVTVKALLENRTTIIKKPEGDSLVIPQSKVVNVLGSISLTRNNTQTSTATESLVNTVVPTMAVSISTEVNADSTATNDSIVPSGLVYSQQGTFANETSSSASLSMQPLSVDMAIQPLMSSCVQVTLPTVNIKVPSPNTLPSLTHNKNSTVSIQSTKVPIPVASTEDIREDEASTSMSGIVETQLNRPLVSSAARMVTSTVNCDSSTTGQTQLSQAMTIVDGKAVTVSAGSGSVNMKNVMLKLTPPPKAAGTSPFLQGFITSKGKFVIPQNTLLQQYPQQVIQASPNRIILANANYNHPQVHVAATASHQLQAKPAQVIAGNLIGSSNIPMKNVALSQGSVGQPISKQQNGQIVIGSQNPTSITGGPSTQTQTVPIHNGNAGIKVMLINPSQLQQQQQQQHSQTVISSAPTITNAASMLQSQKQSHPSNPASELVKQIANNTQILAATQQNTQGFKSPAVSGPQLVLTSASVVNLNSAVTATSPNLTLQNLPQSQVTLKSNMGQTSVTPQLAAQILALQQGSIKGLQLKQVHPQPQQQAGIVLTAKSAQPIQQQQQAQPSVMTVQLGNQLLSGVSTQLQQVSTGGTHIGAVQTPMVGVGVGGKPAVQQGSVVQVALNANQVSPAILGQPQTAQIVQVAASQLSPHLQLANQGIPHLTQQGGVLVQQQQHQPAIVQNQQQQQQVSGFLSKQVNGNLNQHKALQHQVQGGQIQFVINPSVASSSAAVSGTSVLRKAVAVSSIAPQLTSTPQMIRTVVNPSLGVQLPLAAPRIGSPSKLAATQAQLPQLMTQNVVGSAGQILISPIKLAQQTAQVNKMTAVNLGNPSLAASASLPAASQLIHRLQLNPSNQNQVLSVSNVGGVVQANETRAISIQQQHQSSSLNNQMSGGVLSISQPNPLVSLGSGHVVMASPPSLSLSSQHHALKSKVMTPSIAFPLCNPSSVGSDVSIVTENGSASLKNVAGQTLTDAGLVAPEKLGGPSSVGRRNTFSGQEINSNAKAEVQRNTSVDDTSLQAKEIDEKEAALNLLTFANQQM